MNPKFAISVRDLADAVISRVHGEVPNRHDDDVLMAVLRYAERAHGAAKAASDGIGTSLRKATDLGCDPMLGTFASDLAKAADALGETVTLLKAVAAEPSRRFPGEWRGVPLHLVARAIH